MVLIDVSEICSALESSEGEAQHTQVWERSETETIQILRGAVADKCVPGG